MFQQIFTGRVLVLTLFCLLSQWAQAAPASKQCASGLSAGNISVTLEGRGFFLTTDQVSYDQDKKLTVVAPEAGWLDDMKPEHLQQLKDFNLNDLSELAGLMNKGVQKSPLVIDISIRRFENESVIMTPLDVNEVEYENGNLLLTLNRPANIPPVLESTSILFRTWHQPTEESLSTVLGGPRPMKAVCCDCSGGCAALWILFAWCTKCVSFQGGEYCCSACQMPPAPGETCP